MVWFMILVHQTLRFWYGVYSLALFCRPHFLRGLQARSIRDQSRFALIYWFTSDLLYQFPVLSRQRAVLRVCHPDIAGALLERPNQYWELCFSCVFFGYYFLIANNSSWNVWFCLRWRWRSANFFAYWGRQLAKHFTGPCLSWVLWKFSVVTTTGRFFLSPAVYLTCWLYVFPFFEFLIMHLKGIGSCHFLCCNCTGSQFVTSCCYM